MWPTATFSLISRKHAVLYGLKVYALPPTHVWSLMIPGVVAFGGRVCGRCRVFMTGAVPSEEIETPALSTM